MKKLSYKLLLVTGMAVAFSSCLKDKNVDDQVYGMINYENNLVVELAAPPTHFNAENLNFKNADTIFNAAVVQLAANAPASQDVKVTLTLANSAALVSAYNTANGTSFEQLPSNLYTIEGGSLQVTIPAGSRFGYLKFKTNPSKLDPTKSYALGFKIASIETPGYIISGNFGTVITAVGVKNKYDGRYTMRFRMDDWEAAYGIENSPSSWGGEIHMITSGADAIKLFDDWGFGTYIHPARTSAAGYTGFGSTEPKFQFDVNTNKLIAASNDFPNPSNGRQFVINPDVTDSRWDPVTGNIYAAIILKQPGRPDLKIYDTFTYVGPR